MGPRDDSSRPAREKGRGTRGAETDRWVGPWLAARTERSVRTTRRAWNARPVDPASPRTLAWPLAERAFPGRSVAVDQRALAQRPDPGGAALVVEGDEVAHGHPDHQVLLAHVLAGREGVGVEALARLALALILVALVARLPLRVEVEAELAVRPEVLQQGDRKSVV